MRPMLADTPRIHEPAGKLNSAPLSAHASYTCSSCAALIIDTQIPAATCSWDIGSTYWEDQPWQCS